VNLSNRASMLLEPLQEIGVASLGCDRASFVVS